MPPFTLEKRPLSSASVRPLYPHFVSPAKNGVQNGNDNPESDPGAELATLPWLRRHAKKILNPPILYDGEARAARQDSRVPRATRVGEGLRKWENDCWRRGTQSWSSVSLSVHGRRFLKRTCGRSVIATANNGLLVFKKPTPPQS